MSTETKIVNFLVARSATTHRQFRSLLEDMESLYRDLPLHCSVRWLSRGKVLFRFVECLVEIKAFLIEHGKAYLFLFFVDFQVDWPCTLTNLIFVCGVQEKQWLVCLRYGKVLQLNWMSTHGTFKLQLFATLNTSRLFQLITKLMELKLIYTWEI